MVGVCDVCRDYYIDGVFGNGGINRYAAVAPFGNVKKRVSDRKNAYFA